MTIVVGNVPGTSQATWSNDAVQIWSTQDHGPSGWSKEGRSKYIEALFLFVQTHPGPLYSSALDLVSEVHNIPLGAVRRSCEWVCVCVRFLAALALSRAVVSDFQGRQHGINSIVEHISQTSEHPDCWCMTLGRARMGEFCNVSMAYWCGIDWGSGATVQMAPLCRTRSLATWHECASIGDWANARTKTFGSVFDIA